MPTGTCCISSDRWSGPGKITVPEICGADPWLLETPGEQGAESDSLDLFSFQDLPPCRLHHRQGCQWRWPNGRRQTGREWPFLPGRRCHGALVDGENSKIGGCCMFLFGRIFLLIMNGLWLTWTITSILVFLLGCYLSPSWDTESKARRPVGIRAYTPRNINNI